MALRRRDVILASIGLFIAWGYAVSWAPVLRWAGYAFTLGFILPILGLVAVILLTSRGVEYGERNRFARPRGLQFLGQRAWRAEVASMKTRQAYTKQPLYPDSFVISSALDDVLDFIIRDFVVSWYSKISPNPTFSNQVDGAVRAALISLRNKLFETDLVEVVTVRFVPIFTAHFREFYNAERAVRGKHLNRSVTESEELDLAIAGKYNEGKLHPAASLGYSDLKLVQQEYLRDAITGLLPKIMPQSMMTSRAVTVLIQELVSCAVLLPVMQMLAEPDTWNQIMEAYV
jgi:sorting nexin-25